MKILKKLKKDANLAKTRGKSKIKRVARKVRKVVKKEVGANVSALSEVFSALRTGSKRRANVSNAKSTKGKIKALRAKLD